MSYLQLLVKVFPFQLQCLTEISLRTHTLKTKVVVAFERFEYLLDKPLGSIVGTVSKLCSKFVAQHYMDTPSLYVMVR